MRAFIVFCLVAVASADKLGYNYQPVAHSDSGLSFTPGSGIGGSLGGDIGSGLGGGSLASGIGGDNLGSGIGDYASASNLAPQGDYSAASSDAPSYAPQAEFEKEFYTFTANEDDFHDPSAPNQISSTVKQGLRVIFIKGPENKGLENAALALAQHAADQKTDIYVLKKQSDIAELANQLNNLNKNNNNKPEVHFVKYRTSEDAINAQKAIQGQYDSLGGSTQSHDGGIAPVLNFASKAPAPAPSAGHIGSASAPSASYSSELSAPSHSDAGLSAPAASYSSESSAPTSSYIPPAPAASELSNTYLPASILRLFRL